MKKYLSFLLAAIFTIPVTPGINGNTQSFAQPADNNAPGKTPEVIPTCYAPAVEIQNQDRKIEDLENRMDKIEKLEEKKKINNKTTKTTKKNIQSDMKKLNKKD